MTKHWKSISAEKSKHVTMMQLKPRHCRYIIGPSKGPDTLYCGEQKAHGVSYCPAHALIVYEPRRK